MMTHEYLDPEPYHRNYQALVLIALSRPYLLVEVLCIGGRRGLILPGLDDIRLQEEETSEEQEGQPDDLRELDAEQEEGVVG